jgi:acyl-CoA hydrolase
MPQLLAAVEDCVARILAHAGGELRLAAPLGLGKPNVLLNALYARAVADPGLKFTLYTALSLARPRAKSDLERRFLEPFVARHFGADYPDLAYVAALHAGTLPANVRVHEFYLQSGAMLGVGPAQRDYVSLNYTHVARDLVHARLNSLTQLIAVRDEGGRRRYSLASNPDVSTDLLRLLDVAGVARPLVVGVVHPDLPFVGNEAEVDAGFFDLIVDDPACRHTLFALPREPIALADHALGLHASTLVRDGGTLQIGIGSLSEALVAALLLRHRQPDAYAAALRALGHGADTVAALPPFERGLYGASEMVMDGFMHLVRGGVLKRRVHDDLALERAVAAGTIGDVLGADAADALYDAGVLPGHVDAAALARLQQIGVLPATAVVADDAVVLDGVRLPARIGDRAARAAWNGALCGRRLQHGRYLRGAFYLGSKEFYAWLRGLEGDDFSGLSMTHVSDINQLYGGREVLDALQRRDARFFNICMMATALGAAVSDALASGQVVSGVGGQYNFVAMAHALPDGRSVLMLRSTREHAGRLSPNILWNYGHVTIPRHLRDIYVTEYGIADLRGKSDEDCAIAMLGISDARFQDGLAAQAKAAGKLRADYAIPASARLNTPEHLRRRLAPLRADGRFARFPFGSDFSAEELQLIPALQLLGRLAASPPRMAAFVLRALVSAGAPAQAAPALARMGLERPRGARAWLLRRLVSRALADAATP